MLTPEYIKVNNLKKLTDFMGVPFYTDKQNTDNMWQNRTLFLLSCMCELEHENKLPKSEILNDLIDFLDENPTASKLREYLNMIPGYDEKNKKNQFMGTYEQHGYITMGLRELASGYYIRSGNGILNEYKNFNLNLEGSFIYSKNKNKHYLTINSDGFHIQLETEHEMLDNSAHKDNNRRCIKFNDRIFNNVSFSEIVNAITYARFVKDITIENTQAAYFFLN
jgi:hypothetical protein